MLCTIESIRRILVSQKDNIKIGTGVDDTVTTANAEQSIREADVIISGSLRGIYKFPLRNRILLPKTAFTSPASLIYQPETPRQLLIVVNADDQAIAGNNAIAITGTDSDGTAITETLIFERPGAQVTANYFKTVSTSGIIVGSNIIALTNAYFIILSYDILNYICARLACFNLYRDVFCNNSPNELPAAVQSWKDDALKILENIRTKLFVLDDQVAPGDIAIIARPVYNMPTKFFEYRGVAGIERLENEDMQDYDGNHTHSTDDESGSGSSEVTIQTQVIIPPGTWTDSTRPAAPYAGQTGFNTESSQFEGWNGNNWVIIG
ncbi:MAG TPA: hypothetical protein VMV86_01660 [Methanosarcinales archaeon]|nr:hypothetical protein [Methanosarcinales archaeon]